MTFPDYKPDISQNIQFGQFKEKFNATDFKSWFNSLNNHLYALRLDHHLTIDDAAEVPAAQANEGVVPEKSLIRVENQKTNHLQVMQLIRNCLQLDLKQATQNMRFLGKPYTLIKFLRETYLVDEDEKKKALRKEFDAFQRLQGNSFKQMTTCISLIILMCENSGVEISNEEKVTTLLHRIGSQTWAQTVLTIQQTAEGKNWDFEWTKKDLVEKEKAMKEIINKSHLANVAHQAFASLAPVSSSSYSPSIQVPASFPSPAPPFSPSPSPTPVPSPSPVLSQLPIQPPTQSPAPPNIPPQYNQNASYQQNQQSYAPQYCQDLYSALRTRPGWEEPPKRPYKCFNCGLGRHTARKCFLSKAPAGEIAFHEFLEFQQQFEEWKVKMTNKGFPVCFLSVLKSFSAPETKRLQLFSDNEAIIDSGCTTSILKSREYLVNTHKPDKIFEISQANGDLIQVVLQGDLNLAKDMKLLENISVVPDCTLNLLSVSQMCETWNALIIFDKDGVKVTRKKIPLSEAETILSGSQRNGLYHLPLPNMNHVYCTQSN